MVYFFFPSEERWGNLSQSLKLLCFPLSGCTFYQSASIIISWIDLGLPFWFVILLSSVRVLHLPKIKNKKREAWFTFLSLPSSFHPLGPLGVAEHITCKFLPYIHCLHLLLIGQCWPSDLKTSYICIYQHPKVHVFY